MNDNARELEFIDLLWLLWRSRLLLGAFLVIGAIVGATISYAIRPVYKAEVLLSPVAPQSGNSTLARLAQQFAPLTDLAGTLGNLGSGEDMAGRQVAIATLSSRWLTQEFIADRNLLPVLFPKRWDRRSRHWLRRDGISLAPTMDEAVDLFNKLRTVRDDQRTGLVTLAIEWNDPNIAADWANDLVGRVNEFLRARAIDEARRSISFLDGELAQTTVVERRQIIYSLIEQKTSDIMMANVRKEYAFFVVDPAVAHDRKNFVWPNRPVLIAVGLLTGLIAGALFILIRWNARRGIKSPPAVPASVSQAQT